MYLLKEITKDNNVVGLNCNSYIDEINLGLGIWLEDKTDPNLYGFKIDTPNVYMNSNIGQSLSQRMSDILIGETDTEYIYINVGSRKALLERTPKSGFVWNSIEEIDMGVDFKDFIVTLEEVGNEYTVNIEIGNCYEQLGITGQRKFAFNTKFPIQNKSLGVLNIMQDHHLNEAILPIHYAVKEEDLGMKIDTSLDKEPLYYCDGTKDRLILTEDMIVRGNTNFTEELTYNDKRILCEDNLG